MGIELCMGVFPFGIGNRNNTPVRKFSHDLTFSGLIHDVSVVCFCIQSCTVTRKLNQFLQFLNLFHYYHSPGSSNIVFYYNTNSLLKNSQQAASL